MKIDPYYQKLKYRPMALVSATKRDMGYSWGFLGGGFK